MSLKIFVALLAISVAKATVQTNCSCTEQKCIVGRDGRDGKEGRDGRDGKDCIECAKGPKGEKGDNGATGERGPTGPKGQKGDKGSMGLRGEKGNKGDKGEQGIRGVDGTKGEKGMCDEKQLQNLMDKIKGLEEEVQKLKSETVKLDSHNKIAHSVLPAGFSEVRVSDLQLESLHTAAAAACRGSTPTGGSGCCNNMVYPRSKGLSCTQVCKNTGYYVNCDAEMAIMGKRRLARSSRDYVGNFFNYGCDDSSSNPYFETNINPSDKIDFGGYISFCCCRK